MDSKEKKEQHQLGVIGVFLTKKKREFMNFICEILKLLKRKVFYIVKTP